MKKLMLGVLLGFLLRVGFAQLHSFQYEYVFMKTCDFNESIKTFSDKMRCTREKTSETLLYLAYFPPTMEDCFSPFSSPEHLSKRCFYTRKLMTFLTGTKKEWWDRWDKEGGHVK